MGQMTEEQRHHQSLVVWGFIAAPLVGAAALGVGSACLGDGPVAYLVAIGGAVVGYLITLVLGVPAYLVLRKRIRPRFIYPIGVGGFIAAAPVAIGALADSSNAGELIAQLRFPGLVFFCGALGGLAFWLIAIKADPNAHRFFGPRREQPADAFD
jgi:hypothetical protein